MRTLFDAHNHIHLKRVAVRNQLGPSQVPSHLLPRQLLQSLREAEIRCATGSTQENDWTELETLSSEFRENLHCGYAIHPWWCDTTTEGWQLRLKAVLARNKRAFVGECGLDAYRAARYSGLALDKQKEILLPQMKIALEFNRPIVLHCVKAWASLRECLDIYPGLRFLIHRFRGDISDAQEMIYRGGYVSIHRDSLQHEPSRQALLRIPKQRLLVETDYDGPRVEALPIADELQEVLAETALLLNWTPDQVEELTYQNAVSFYGL